MRKKCKISFSSPESLGLSYVFIGEYKLLVGLLTHYLPYCFGERAVAGQYIAFFEIRFCLASALEGPYAGIAYKPYGTRFTHDAASFALT